MKLDAKRSKVTPFDKPSDLILWLRNEVGSPITPAAQDAVEEAAKSDDAFRAALNEHVDSWYVMKRDMNLIRLLLLETEGEDPKPDLSALLIEAAFVHGEIITDGNPSVTCSLQARQNESRA